MAVVPTILPALDALRAIGGMLGLRVFAVTVRKRIWAFPAGGRPGIPGSSKIDIDTVLVNQGADGNFYPVRVRQVSRSEAFASGGQYTARDLRVGPMTPSYIQSILANPGGFDDQTVDPAPTASATEIIWLLSTNDGATHGLPANGIVCEKRGEEATALHYNVILRATGRAPT